MRFMFLVVDLLRGVCRRISEGHQFHGVWGLLPAKRPDGEGEQGLEIADAVYVLSSRSFKGGLQKDQ